MSMKSILPILLYKYFQMKGAKWMFEHKSRFRLSISLIFPNDFVLYSLKKLFSFYS